MSQIKYLKVELNSVYDSKVKLKYQTKIAFYEDNENTLFQTGNSILILQFKNLNCIMEDL